MLFTMAFLDGLVDGRHTVTFRRWREPRVRPGSQMRTAVGVLEVDAVDRVSERALSEADAASAGYASKAALIEALQARGGDGARGSGGRATSAKGGGRSGRSAVASRAPDGSPADAGDIYRIALRLVGPDPRVALREKAPSPQELDTLRDRLARLDAVAARGGREPWTLRVLTIIAEHPEGTRAAALAPGMGLETLPFKLLVRKLKEFGLTESLEVGYRLSPRGRALLAHLRAKTFTTSAEIA